MRETREILVSKTDKLFIFQSGDMSTKFKRKVEGDVESATVKKLKETYTGQWPAAETLMSELRF